MKRRLRLRPGRTLPGSSTDPKGSLEHSVPFEPVSSPSRCSAGRPLWVDSRLPLTTPGRSPSTRFEKFVVGRGARGRDGQNWVAGNARAGQDNATGKSVATVSTNRETGTVLRRFSVEQRERARRKARRPAANLAKSLFARPSATAGLGRQATRNRLRLRLFRAPQQ